MMKAHSISVKLQPASRMGAKLVARAAVILVVAAGFIALGMGSVPAHAADDSFARPAPTPLTKEAAAALVEKLKETLSETIESDDEIKAITAKWDRRPLAGKTRAQILDLLFADVKAVVSDAELQNAIRELWQEIGGEEEPAEPAKPAKPAEPVRPTEPAPAPTPPRDQQRPLTISVEAGQKFKVDATSDLNTTSEVMGQTMETQ